MKCEVCRDMGIVLAIFHSDKSETLIRCDCETGTENPRKFPQWKGYYSSLCRINSCPNDWFIPEFQPNPTEKDVFASIYNKTVLWTARVKLAEDFWKSFESKTIQAQSEAVNV